MLTSQKHLFQLPDDVTYLNCAYLSPQLRSVETAGFQAVSHKNLPFMVQPVDFFTEVIKLKSLFANIINASDPTRIAIIPSASYGIATVAKNVKLRAGDNIMVAEDQFPSNIYSWQRLTQEANAELRVVAAPIATNRTEAWNEAILHAIDERTRMVAIANAHWADGTRFDLMAIRQKTREVGALLVIDGTQSVGALPIDVKLLQPDALICASYKWLFGPYSTALAYYGSYFDNGIPIEENWINRLNSEDFRGLVKYEPAYQPGAGRYSVGEQSNFVLVPMLIAALEQIIAWKVINIQTYCKNISRKPLEILQELGCKVEDETTRCGHLFGIRLDDALFDFQALSQAFAEHQVYVSVRGTSIRVAPHVYNDERDFDRLIQCFEKARRKVYY